MPPTIKCNPTEHDYSALNTGFKNNGYDSKTFFVMVCRKCGNSFDLNK